MRALTWPAPGADRRLVGFTLAWHRGIPEEAPKPRLLVLAATSRCRLVRETIMAMAPARSESILALSVRLAVVAGIGLAGCGSRGPAAGVERGPCYGNGTCNTGLSCSSAVCVPKPFRSVESTLRRLRDRPDGRVNEIQERQP